MLLVKTELKVSAVHGIGLFAAQNIKKGDVIWRYHFSTCQIYPLNEFIKLCHELPHQGIENLLNYSYLKNRYVYYITDNTRFINHSSNPNVELISENCEVALRDIDAGEELIENYCQSYDIDDFFQHYHLFATNSKKELISFLENMYVTGKDISCTI